MFIVQHLPILFELAMYFLFFHRLSYASGDYNGRVKKRSKDKVNLMFIFRYPSTLDSALPPRKILNETLHG